MGIRAGKTLRNLPVQTELWRFGRARYQLRLGVSQALRNEPWRDGRYGEDNRGLPGQQAEAGRRRGRWGLGHKSMSAAGAPETGASTSQGILLQRVQKTGICFLTKASSQLFT